MNSSSAREAAYEGAPMLVQWFGPARARWAWVLIGLLYVGFVGAGGAYVSLHAVKAQAWPRAALALIVTALALLLWLRIWIINWRLLQSDWPQVKPEETGIWGVGGPGIRQPGGTGIFPRAKLPDEDEPGGG